MDNTPTIEQIVSLYNLKPHPEGGFYNETYRSATGFETKQGARVASTAILFLITSDSISHFHRLTADEGWHYHLGDPLRLLEITAEGELIETIMGRDILSGQKLQHIVPAGNWFASTSKGAYSLVGCTVSPGFEFSDFEMAKKEDLKALFPAHTQIIEEFSLG